MRRLNPLYRIRWANDAYYDKPGGHNRYRAHDVSFFAGARGGVELGGARVALGATSRTTVLLARMSSSLRPAKSRIFRRL